MASLWSVSDPGFPRECQPLRGEGTPAYYLAIFSKNCLKLKNFCNFRNFSQFSAKSWQNSASIDIQWLQPIKCQSWQPARIWQKIPNYRKTRIIIIVTKVMVLQQQQNAHFTCFWLVRIYSLKDHEVYPATLLDSESLLHVSGSWVNDIVILESNLKYTNVCLLRVRHKTSMQNCSKDLILGSLKTLPWHHCSMLTINTHK